VEIRQYEDQKTRNIALKEGKNKLFLILDIVVTHYHVESSFTTKSQYFLDSILSLSTKNHVISLFHLFAFSVFFFYFFLLHLILFIFSFH